MESPLGWQGDQVQGTGHGPENITALRRSAIGVIRSQSPDTVAAAIQPTVPM
jgi:hypothetical protein